jgi:hypothetical protein
LLKVRLELLLRRQVAPSPILACLAGHDPARPLAFLVGWLNLVPLAVLEVIAFKGDRFESWVFVAAGKLEWEAVSVWILAAT